MLVWQAPTRVMNPSVPQHIIDDAMQADPYPSGEGHGMVIFLIGDGTGQAASAAMFVGRQFQGSSSWMRLAG